MVLAGVILGEAAVLAGKHAAQTAAYGIASRGGFAKSEVVISDTEIEYPAVEQPDVVVALSRSAVDRYLGKLAPGSLLIYDNAIDGNFSGDGVTGLPLSATVREYRKEKGVSLPLNILSLGVLAAVTGAVDMDCLAAAVSRRFKKDSGTNLRALELGFALGLNVSQRKEVNRPGPAAKNLPG